MLSVYEPHSMKAAVLSTTQELSVLVSVSQWQAVGLCGLINPQLSCHLLDLTLVNERVTSLVVQ